MGYPYLPDGVVGLGHALAQVRRLMATPLLVSVLLVQKSAGHGGCSGGENIIDCLSGGLEREREDGGG